MEPEREITAEVISFFQESVVGANYPLEDVEMGEILPDGSPFMRHPERPDEIVGVYVVNAGKHIISTSFVLECFEEFKEKGQKNALRHVICPIE